MGSFLCQPEFLLKCHLSEANRKLRRQAGYRRFLLSVPSEGEENDSENDTSGRKVLLQLGVWLQPPTLASRRDVQYIMWSSSGLAASVSGTLPRPSRRTSITGALYNGRVLETAASLTRCLSDAGVSSACLASDGKLRRR